MVWAAFIALTALHIYANVRAMRALRLRSLNCARLDVLLAHYLGQVSACLQQWRLRFIVIDDAPAGWPCTVWVCQGGGKGTVLSPEEVAALEPLAPPALLRCWQWARSGGRRPLQLVMGARIADLVRAACALHACIASQALYSSYRGFRAIMHACGAATQARDAALLHTVDQSKEACGGVQGVEGRLARLGEEEQGLRYIVGLDRTGREARVVLRQDAGSSDVLAAYLYGYLLLHSEAPVVSGPLDVSWAQCMPGT